MRAQDALALDELNRALSAWLCVAYHQSLHSEIGQTPKERYEKGLTVIRHVDMAAVLASFMQKVTRRVHKDFCDIQLHNRFYRVDQKLRGDSVEVHYDPFAAMDTVELYSLRGQYLGSGTLHHRQIGDSPSPSPLPAKPKHRLLDLLLREHQEQLAAHTQGIDYRKVLSRRSWPFYAFAKTFAQLLGREEGISAFSAQELETLKKLYNQNPDLSEPVLKDAFARTHHQSFPYVVFELKEILQRKE